MMLRPIFDHPAGPSLADLRRRALSSAIVLRDCSLRANCTDAERRACRTLMRGQAHQWRHPDHGQLY